MDAEGSPKVTSLFSLKVKKKQSVKFFNYNYPISHSAQSGPKTSPGCWLGRVGIECTAAWNVFY